MLLAGPEGSGKSHLAAIWAEQAGARSTAAHALTPANVPGALATGALVVEDLRSPDFDERALFHLLNLAREDQAFVLITAREPPSALQVELRDLRSRLRAVPVVSLLPPDDQLFRALIVKFCADRQLAIDETVVSYLATRIERSYAAARQAVEFLDREALRLGRPVTRALAAELLGKPDRQRLAFDARARRNINGHRNVIAVTHALRCTRLKRRCSLIRNGPNSSWNPHKLL